MIASYRNSPFYASAQVHFRSQLLPKPFIGGTKLLAFVDLKHISRPRNSDLLDGFDPARAATS